ncbi:uncharacterized protein [Periplaneta americana]|uniref:uncharacterized protein n=1 Tax=Periplaneta americana TaxID=6978 RepID=UPI0037E84AC6
MECNGCEVKFFDSVILKRKNQVLNFLCDHGVLKREATCGRCGGDLKLQESTLNFHCGKKLPKGNGENCGWNVSARKGTFLGNSSLSIEDAFLFVSVLLHLKPPRQQFIKEELGLSNSTIVNCYSFCREIFIGCIQEDSSLIGGKGITVELGEAKFGKIKYQSGRIVKGQWVFGGLDRKSRKTFLVPVKSRDSDTLLSVIKRYILPGTTIVSDCWRAYSCLEEEDYVHLAENNTYNFVDPVAGANTNTIRRVWREVRSNIPRFGMKKNHFAGYLAEYLFKAKYPREERLHHFLKAAASLYPPQY